jgi:hypothetical protein
MYVLARLVAVLILLAALTAKASATTFSNATPIAIAGTTSSSGSQIQVQGFAGAPTSIVVGVSRLTHSHAANLSLVLVGPTGAALVLEGACGGTTSISSASLQFSDGGTAMLPQSSGIVNGTYKPTQWMPLGSFPAPGPGLAYQSPAITGTSTLSAVFGFNNPNGIWSLYAFDPVSGDSGQIASGWNLQITGPPEPIPALPRATLWILGILLALTTAGSLTGFPSFRRSVRRVPRARS